MSKRVAKRVAKRLHEHDEAARLLELDSDDTPFLIEDESVRTRRKAVRKAGQLYVLGQDPAALGPTATRGCDGWSSPSG